ncbi:MAG: A/G-specific adenine glycosylase [Ilumatobacteraceae bacterium]
MIDVPAVLAWGMPQLSDLPWRATRDPWAILVAEVMLQQTQTARVAPRWESFLARFATPAGCVAASLGDVLQEWHGLGYPRRARNLHLAAEQIVGRHGGRVPDELASLLALPGVGPYTARAVLAFAFGHDVGVVDTNIARVLARAGEMRLTPVAAQRLADSLVPRGQGWAWNQVLMDLGARACRPLPQCAGCPVASTCSWHLSGHPPPDPAIGSASVSTSQPPYEGSDRQARGAVLHALLGGRRPASDFRPTIVDGLVADGLVERAGDELRLPT